MQDHLTYEDDVKTNDLKFGKDYNSPRKWVPKKKKKNSGYYYNNYNDI